MDNRRLILLLVFSFSLIMLWDAWQRQSAPKVPATAAAPAASAATPAGLVPTPTVPVAPGATAAVPITAAVVPGAVTAKVMTDLYIADISSRGGDITRLELVRHPDTDVAPNACSKLYGAAWKAAKALGYTRLITYTLPEEGGASLRAAGWRLVGTRGGGTWSRPSRPRADTPDHLRGPKCLWRAPDGADKGKRPDAD